MSRTPSGSHFAATPLAGCHPRNRKPPIYGGFLMERTGLEPVTPSLQILLRGGLGGSAVVGAEEYKPVALRGVICVGRGSSA
jgi:hypothetical protein